MSVSDTLIFYIHLCMYICAIFIPFVAPRRILQVFSIIVPFMFLHWSLNDDTCLLTMMEEYVSGIEKHKTFTGRVMKGVFIMSDDVYGKISKMLFFTLWMITQFRLGQLDFALSSFYRLRRPYV